MVYEVQQTSDITYRVYDWDRPTTEGRKLHIKQALDVLDPYAGGEVVSAEGISNDGQPLLTCEYFNLRVHKNSAKTIVCNTHHQSFHTLTMVDGEGTVGGDGWEHHLDRFETLLIPASVGMYSIFPGDLICLDATTVE